MISNKSSKYALPRGAWERGESGLLQLWKTEEVMKYIKKGTLPLNHYEDVGYCDKKAGD